MVRLPAKFKCSCLRISRFRIRVRSPPLQSNPAYNSIKASHENEYYDNTCDSNFNNDTQRFKEKGELNEGNRIMVVVDASEETKGAVQWALTHTVQKEDTVILVNIAKPANGGSNSESELDPKAYGILYSLRSVCQSRRPGVQVEVVALTGREKGPMIVDQAKEHKASLLILGHRKRSKAWRFWMRWTGRKRSVVDYCIQNADCMTIAVRRKSRKLGGYLITTKRHKNFWLLA